MTDLDTRAQQIMARYPAERSRSALLPLLHIVQERDGYLTSDGLAEVAGILGLTTAEVSGVATFYSMFYLRPKGRHVVSVCHNFACNLAGAESVIANLEEHLGVTSGGTTADGAITLERVECLAACQLAPMLQVDHDQMIGPMDVAAARDLVDRLRGAPLREAAEGAPAAPVSPQTKRVEASTRQASKPPAPVEAPKARVDREAATSSSWEMFEPDVAPPGGDAAPHADEHAGQRERERELSPKEDS